MLNKRYLETLLSKQVEMNNIRVIEPAVATAKIWPLPSVVLGGFFAVAILIALSLVALLEFMDSTIKSWRDIEARFGFKVLGILPVIEEKEERKTLAADVPQRSRDLYIYDHPRL